MLSLSTAWFRTPELTTAEILAEVRRLGFRAMEWAVSAARLDQGEVAAAVRAGEVAVTSVHALAGLHGDAPINMQGGDLGSADAGKRQATVDAMCRTIDLARRLGARAVVVHAGGIEGPLHDRCVHMMRHWDEVRLSPTFDRDLADLRRERRQAAPACLDRVVASLEEVLRRAGEFPLGLETRYVYCQLPLPDELEQIRAAVGRDCLGYWHDVGHARIQQLFGGVPEMSWLDRFADRLLGVHLHDMVGTRDHKPPGQGELDLRGVADRVAGLDCLRVVEVAGGFTAPDLVAGRKHLESLGLT